ncbi:MAG: growth inhibitor PemK [Gammaproteobacteria bacterium]|nr:MAG: growth inhibitor PemK [Gammaproteobacteria bacterium]
MIARIIPSGRWHLFGKIYFTDLSDYKIRPVLVIKEMGEDCLCLQLTSQLKNKEIIIDNSDLIAGQIKKESLVVVPKNFTLHKSILFKYLATIHNDKLKTIFDLFCKKLGCSKS